MTVRLVAVDKGNWRDCVKLSPGPGNENFVAPNVYSLAEAHFEPAFVPMAIYDDETLVGFLMYGSDATDGRYWLIRFMIDAKYQGKGLGRAALQEAIRLIRERHGVDEITLSYHPQNLKAKSFYAAAGFVETGEIHEGEVVARLNYR